MPGKSHGRRSLVGCSPWGHEEAEREYQAATAQERPRGATPRPRSGAAAGRSYPASKVRGGSRGATLHPKSGAAAESARLQQRGAAERTDPTAEARGAAERSYPASEIRGGGGECQAAIAQEQPRGPTPRPTPGAAAGRSYPTSSGGCAGAGGPRGAIPRSRSGGAAVRRYPSSKVRSSGCTLLEQP